MTETNSLALKGHTFPGSQYDNQQRIEAAVHYMVHGSLTKSAKACSIPPTTLYDWTKAEWWPTLSEQIRRENEIEFQSGFTRIVEAAIGQIEDRLEHGDVKLVKTKNGYAQQRVPISAKDATVVAGITYDKLRLSLSLPTSVRSTSEKSLEVLAEKFKKIAKEYQREVIDVTPPEADLRWIGKARPEAGW
jgi:hypothetical protein